MSGRAHAHGYAFIGEKQGTDHQVFPGDSAGASLKHLHLPLVQGVMRGVSQVTAPGPH